MPDGENDTRVPVTVLTGLLGSDKTTLLKRGVRSLRRPSRGVHSFGYYHPTPSSLRNALQGSW